MTEENSSQNDADSSKTPVGRRAAKAAETDMKRRFGAMAFAEDIAPEENETDILSLDSLRQAFASLENERGDEPEASIDVPPENIAAEDDITLKTKESEGVIENIDDEIAKIEDYQPPLEESVSIELSPKTIIEAMLFVGDRENRPLDAHRAAEKMRNVTLEEIDQAIDSLIADYDRLGCPYTIQKEEGGYRMVLRPEFGPILEKSYGKIREARLSQQAIDILAIVAYRQPITAEEVQNIRKQPSGSILSQLVRRGMLQMQRELKDKKKIVLYRTTDRFLELFQLESIDDLPIAEEIEFR